MMGTKIRSFSLLPHDLSLEDLVPHDHFYRRLQATLDLSFVRELVTPLYANGGRPSVDPVVFSSSGSSSRKAIPTPTPPTPHDEAWRFSTRWGLLGSWFAGSCKFLPVSGLRPACNRVRVPQYFPTCCGRG